MKTLIAYATNSGTTEKAAKMIAKKLNDAPDMVNLGKEKLKDISAYDFVLIGGPIKMGRLHKSSLKFIKKHKRALMHTRFGLFLASGYPAEMQKYLKAILDADLRNKADVVTDIGFAYYLENLGPVLQRVVMEMGKIDQSVEAYKMDEIEKIASIING